MDICFVVTVPSDNAARCGAPDIITMSSYDTDAVAVGVIIPGSFGKRDAGSSEKYDSDKEYIQFLQDSTSFIYLRVYTGLYIYAAIWGHGEYVVCIRINI